MPAETSPGDASALWGDGTAQAAAFVEPSLDRFLP